MRCIGLLATVDKHQSCGLRAEALWIQAGQFDGVAELPFGYFHDLNFRNWDNSTGFGISDFSPCPVGAKPDNDLAIRAGT